MNGVPGGNGMESPSLGWELPPGDLHLGESDVHIWKTNLNITPSVLNSLAEALSEDELSKASRFHFDIDRTHYIAARGCLRMLLGRYLHLDPAQIQFSYSEFGKPELRNPFNTSLLRFNVSHSAGIGLFAFTLKNDIGIDIEHLRSDLADEGIARRNFSPLEVKTFLSVSEGEREKVFYACWTRKEAYIKAHGEGLSMPLDSFDVSCAPGELACLLATRPDPSESSLWSLFAFEPDSGYVGALAVKARKLHLKLWQWSAE